MTQIGVISDTHLQNSGEACAFLQNLASLYFRDVELVLHAGDIVAHDVLACLHPHPVYAVRGNMDPAIAELPYKRILQINGHRIGLIHGWGAPLGLAERVRNEFAGTALDCLVYGHSHAPCCRRQDGLLLFNPGSATNGRGKSRCSIGLLTVETDKIHGHVIELPD